jgi:hypothetical protein
MGFDSYSTTAASNTSLNGINVAEGCPPSGVNDALRQLAADGKTLSNALLNASYVWGGTSGGAANVQTVTLSPVPAALTTGMLLRFLAGFTNTAAATLNPNSLGATNIKRIDGSALQAGDLVSGQLVTVVYTGTNFILLKDTTPQFRGAQIKLSADVTGWGSAVFGTVTWSSAVFDTNTFFAGGAPTVLTVPTGVSWVRVTAAVTITTTASATQNYVKIQKNGADLSPAISIGGAITAATSIGINATTAPISVVATDTFRVQVYQNSGAGATLVAASSWFAIDVLQ